jgi:iron(III) transport system permease protein
LFTTLRNIVLPLVRNSVIGGWIYVFIVSFKAVGSIVLLTTPQNQVFSTYVWALYTSGSGSVANGNLAAASVVLMIILWALIGGMLLVQRRVVAEQFVS